MLSTLFYIVVIFSLVFWVEQPLKATANSLIRRKNPAEELESWIKKFNWGQRGQLQDPGHLPQYKFYTEVVEILLSLARKMGGSYQDSILFLREGLQEDRQFEKKLKEIISGTWIQMGLMVVLTWGFILGALALVEVKVPLYKLFFIGLWQSLGLFMLPIVITFFRVRFFGDIGKLWKIFYVLRSLTRVPLSRTEIMSIAGVGEIKSIKQKSLEHIVEKLKETCQKALQMGGSYEEDLLSLMAELRFQEKWHFELFEKRLMVVKLILLSVFFLPSYLAFIYILLGDLLVLM